jgi:hypothetical protein
LEKLKTHITIFLVWIFIFPIVVQGLHFLKHSPVHQCCKIESETTSEQIDKLSFHDFSGNEKETHCYICDFKVSFYNVIPSSSQEANADLPFIRLETIAEKPYISFCKNSSLPRAPPVFV